MDMHNFETSITVSVAMSMNFIKVIIFQGCVIDLGYLYIIKCSFLQWWWQINSEQNTKPCFSNVRVQAEQNISTYFVIQ